MFHHLSIAAAQETVHPCVECYRGSYWEVRFAGCRRWTGPRLPDRDQARALNEPGSFFEVFCKCSIEECERRDPKGLYLRARKGEIAEFTDRPRRDNTARNKAVAEELGNPLTVLDIGLSPGHILDVPGICQK